MIHQPSVERDTLYWIVRLVGTRSGTQWSHTIDTTYLDTLDFWTLWAYINCTLTPGFRTNVGLDTTNVGAEDYGV